MENERGNHVDTITIVGGLTAATGLGFGIGVGARLLRIQAAARRDLKRLRRNREEVGERLFDLEEQTTDLSRPDGRKRDSSIAGIYDEVLRHVNGDYSCAWEAELEPTMLAHDQTIEARCDALARTLSVDKPPGTIIQFRFSSGSDPGHSILKHFKARGDGALAHPEASRLHASGLSLHGAAVSADRYRQSMLSVWARVPGKRKADDANVGLNAFIPRALGEIKRNGWSSVPTALRRGWEETADDGVVRRLVKDEIEAKEQAEKVFRLIARECPLSMKRLEGDKLWEAVYLGHRQDAQSVPILPSVFGLDVRNYLCCETVSCEGNYVMHGSHPAAVVSAFIPPQPFVTADALRAIVFNPALNFRHTMVAEFVYPDQRKIARQLDRRIRQVTRTSIRGDGRVKQSPEARASLTDLETVRDHITGSREALIEMRFYVIVYAPPIRAFGEKKELLRFLDRACEQVITALRSIPGVEAAREEPESLQTLYPKSLVGEANPRPTGREITEVAGSLAALIPTESAWEGARRPHMLCSTPTGRLIGIDFFDRAANPSPLAIAMGASGSGKSVFVASIINSALATLPEAQVKAIDFGESFGPHVDAIGGRHLRFNVSDPRTINTWDYEGLERGKMPDEIQIALVVMEMMLLARVKADDSVAEDILTTLVTEVYRNEAPRNSRGGIKREPTLSNLLALLESYPFENQLVRDRAATLQLALEKYRGHQWIDAPTHPDFAAESSYDVYELDSLDNFPQDIREALAGRVASRVVRSIGRLKEDGTLTPTLLAFDEVWKIRDKYPRILDVIRRGARQGRKENVVTLLATQAYEDFEQLHDVTKNAGVKIIGKQIGDYSKLVSDAGLSENAAAAISAIRNVAGEYAQYVLTIGSGSDQIVEMIQVDLSPAELWTFTTNPNERNARARVSALRPDWSLGDVIEWLAAVYPRGLAAAGLVEIDETVLEKQ
ncbi:MAG: VirB4 family type IV secretion system protein [Blastocatellia bacterium]